jgi:RNA polymerase sigma-70 factor (ECF subfamily)
MSFVRDTNRNGDGQTGTGELAELVVAVGRGDDAAFDKVFRQVSVPVYRAVLNVLGDVSQAEEVAQDVLTEIWRTAGRYDPAKGPAVAWVLMIARRRAIDRLRSGIASVRRDRMEFAITGSWDQVSEAVQDNHDREQLRRGLSRLTGPQRQAITLAFYSRLTYAEVAGRLGIPAGTVKTRIRSALATLRQYMADGRLRPFTRCPRPVYSL